MSQSTSIEAVEYSRWDDDDSDLEAPADDVAQHVAQAVKRDAAIDRETAEGAPSAVRELAVDANAKGERLDKWLAARLSDYSRARLQRWIVDGHVRVNGEAAGTRHALWEGDVVSVAAQASDDETAAAPEDVPLDIVHEDDALIVIDKRAGLVVHPASGNWSGTMLNGLLHHAPALAQVPRAGIVHRLDKDTSGLMVVAKTVVAQTDLVRQLQARTVGRTYIALVHGTPPASGRIDFSIGRDPRERTRMAAFASAPGAVSRAPSVRAFNPAAKPAATRFETLASVGPTKGSSASLVVCTLETGRTHQIRVHMQAIGDPLIGDATYGSRRRSFAFARQALHAWRLRLVHPTTRAVVQWTAEIPDDLAALAADLEIDVESHLAKFAARERDA